MQHSDFLSQIDALTQLASEDAEAFEAEREKLIDAFFATVPEDKMRRLRGLQFQIDMERRRAKTPLASCIRLSTMMWETFGRLQANLCDLSNGERPHSLMANRAKKNAAILEFRQDDITAEQLSR